MGALSASSQYSEFRTTSSSVGDDDGLPLGRERGVGLADGRRGYRSKYLGEFDSGDDNGDEVVLEECK